MNRVSMLLKMLCLTADLRPLRLHCFFMTKPQGISKRPMASLQQSAICTTCSATGCCITICQVHYLLSTSSSYISGGDVGLCSTCLPNLIKIKFFYLVDSANAYPLMSVLYLSKEGRKSFILVGLDLFNDNTSFETYYPCYTCKCVSELLSFSK